MENASKALLMSASIIIGVLLLSMLTFLFYFMANYSESIEENLEANELYEFNMKFLIYSEREDLTAQDVVSIYNLVQNNNVNYDDQDDEHKIKLTLDNSIITENTINKILENNLNVQELNFNKYECKIQSYYNGRVNVIELKTKK